MKIALITGVTGGIGYSIAQQLISNNYKLVVIGRNKTKLIKVIEDLGKDNFLYWESFDLIDDSKIESFVKNYTNKGIYIDVLINNSGSALGLDSFQDCNVNQMLTMIDVNLRALMLLTYHVLQVMKIKNKGHIINIGSTAGQVAYENGTAYCTSKAGVKTFSDGLRLDLIKTKIKVTNIMPGIVETNFSEVRFNGDLEKAKAVYEGIESLQPEDISEACWYVINQPERVQIGELTLLANNQGNGFTIHRQ